MVTKKRLVDVASETGLEFHYQKAPDYRTIHADGALLSSTPRAHFALTIYNERGVIPRKTRRSIISQDEESLKLGEEEAVDSLNGIMRQVETTIIMDRRTLEEIRRVLNEIHDEMNDSEIQEGMDDE